jgi:sirohydrochlorin ferrochelatase
MTTALILAGHGSHISAETAGIVWRQVDKLRAMGVADEVTATFWKETPSFRGVFNSLSAQDVTVVPLFTAQGYFTQTVIPAEMGILEPHPPNRYRVSVYREGAFRANIFYRSAMRAPSMSIPHWIRLCGGG